LIQPRNLIIHSEYPIKASNNRHQQTCRTRTIINNTLNNPLTALHLLLLFSNNKGITAPAPLIRFNKGTGTVRPLFLLRTSIKVVGMDNRRTGNLNRVRTVSRRLEGMASLLLLSLFSRTDSLRGVTDSLLGVTDSLPPLRTVRLRLRRLTAKVKVQDNLQLLLMGKDNLLLQLTDNLNLQLLLMEHL
jgi:hypothetical protein